MTVREYLQQKHYDYKEVSRGSYTEAIMNCPFCDDHEKKFGISLETGAFKCLHENNCGKQGSFWDFQKLLNDEPVRLGNYEFLPKVEVTYEQPKTKGKKLSNQIVDYLHSRGFTDETIESFSLMQKDDTTIMIPFFKENKLANIKYRSIIDKTMWQEKNPEPCLFNHDRADSDLIITEGEYDTMALAQYGYKAVSVPSGSKDFRWIENEWDWLEKFQTIYLCYDNDKAGQDGFAEAIRKLGAWRCKVVIFPEKDANDCLMNGVTKEIIDQCFLNAKEYPPVTLTCPGDHAEKILELFLNPDKLNGIPTFLHGLDKYLKGWREGEVTIWAGDNGAGKSSILSQHMLHLAKQGIKTCIVSLEMNPDRYLRWAILQYLGRTYYTKENTEEILDSISWMNGKIFIVNTTDVLETKEMFDIFTYAARKYGVTHFIIDSLLKIKLPGKNEYDEQKVFIDQLTGFAKKYHSHMHLVAHLRKQSKDNAKAGKSDVKGSSDITNLASNVLLLTKYEAKDGGKDANLEVMKNREFGDYVGIPLYFDKLTKRFKELQE